MLCQTRLLLVYFAAISAPFWPPVDVDFHWRTAIEPALKRKDAEFLGILLIIKFTDHKVSLQQNIDDQQLQKRFFKSLRCRDGVHIYIPLKRSTISGVQVDFSERVGTLANGAA